jgi:hypothetical protein
LPVEIAKLAKAIAGELRKPLDPSRL